MDILFAVTLLFCHLSEFKFLTSKWSLQGRKLYDPPPLPPI